MNLNSFNGILLINKPAQMTSFGVVARVRRKLSQLVGKKLKVGHTGTLDPFATGLMIIVVGDYCKRANEFSKLDKEYEATLVLGKISSTGDPEGELTNVSDYRPTRQEVEQVLKQFTGVVTQTPPQFSAIKINGVRAYKLARKGETVQIPTRSVSVFSLELLSYEYPKLAIRTHVSSGTYIRTLAEDIGKVLGTGAYTLVLNRTKVGQWTLRQSLMLSDENDGVALSQQIMTLD